MWYILQGTVIGTVLCIFIDIPNANIGHAYIIGIFLAYVMTCLINIIKDALLFIISRVMVWRTKRETSCRVVGKPSMPAPRLKPVVLKQLLGQRIHE